MPFAGYLENSEINQLTEAALTGGLLNVSRETLLAGIPAAYVASLGIRPAPIDQFTADLVAINSVEKMADGLVPIVKLLENAAFQLKLRGKLEARVFEQFHSQIGNVAGGVPTLPDPALLSEVVTNERIIGDDDTVDLMFLARGLDVAKAVARINVPRFESGAQVIASNGAPWVLRGTAWLIGPNLAITNHHVINARTTDERPATNTDLELQARNAVLEFDFDAEDATVTRARVAKLITISDMLDYALLELIDAPDRAIPKLAKDLVVHDATTRMAVNIVQHPRGGHKQVAFRNNLVTAADRDTLRYYTDTDFGSSGSPVCDDRWHVVALHRGAKHVPGANYQGKDEAYVNFGSQIQAILSEVRASEPEVVSRILAAQPA